jgi:hypothetical protein
MTLNAVLPITRVPNAHIVRRIGLRLLQFTGGGLDGEAQAKIENAIGEPEVLLRGGGAVRTREQNDRRANGSKQDEHDSTRQSKQHLMPMRDGCASHFNSRREDDAHRCSPATAVRQRRKLI